MTSTEKQLQSLFRKLSERDQQSLIAFAEFLCGRGAGGGVDERVQLPVSIPRPEVETVPAAIKRLRNIYPMLDASGLLSGASELMSQHLMQGCPALDIINELEVLFEQYYQQYQTR